MEIETAENCAGILQFVQKKSPPDFTIINHGIKYDCHLNVIAMSSKKIASYHFTKRPATLELKTKYKLNFLQDVLDFFYGNSIIFNFSNYKEISILSNYFEAEYLKEICARASSFFDYSNSLLKLDYSDITQKEIDFFATFFQVFSSHEIFKKIHFDLMKEIISSDKLTLVNEDFLVHWILNDYKDVESQKKLLSFVVFEKVSFRGFKEIFSSIQNLDEIQDKIQREFVKDPRKRNLTTERNPRYFEKAEELNAKILGFDISTVYTFNFSPKLNDEEKERENNDDLQDEENKKSQNHSSFSLFSHQRERGQFSPKPFHSYSTNSRNLSPPSKSNASYISPPFSMRTGENEGNFFRVGQKSPTSFSGQSQKQKQRLRQDEEDDEGIQDGGRNFGASSENASSNQSNDDGRLSDESDQDEEEEDKKKGGSGSRPLLHLFDRKERMNYFTSDSDSDLDEQGNEKRDIVDAIRMLMPKSNKK